MLARRGLILRFARFLVALTAFLIAQPVGAARVVDPIVMVASAEAIATQTELAEHEDEDGGEPAVIRVLARDAARTLAPLQSTRALREHMYLLHCALLR
jgi:hypothetical protein